MGPLDALIHLLNFMAPALCLAVLTPSLTRIFTRKVSIAPVWWAQVAINFAFCMLMLVSGLVFFGRDGKMASYAAMVLACASSQTWMLRKAWR